MSPESLTDEHRRLERQVAELQREHDELTAKPFNRELHAQHRDRLLASIAELHAHAKRLRNEHP